MEHLGSIATVVIIGIYGAMLGLCVLMAELVKVQKARRRDAEALRDAARAEAEAARADAAVARSHAARAEALRAAAEADSSEARARVEKLYSAGADLARQVAWRRIKVMGGSEYRVYKDLCAVVTEAETSHFLFPQVACGAFLAPAPTPAKPALCAEARHVLSRKYVDFLLVDWRGIPVAVIEYQGADHYRGRAYDSDQAKRIACHRAGIAFIEVPAEGLQAAQRAAMLQAMGRAPRIAAE